MRPQTALFVILPLIAIVAAFALVSSRGAGAGGVQDGVFWDEDVAAFVRRRVAHTYVDELDEARSAEAFYDAMDAYVHSLDDYCDFIAPDEYRRWSESTKGEYAGLGIKITSREVEDGLAIAGVLPGGPAAQVGVRVGDVLVEADGRSLAAIALQDVEARSLLKGAPGSRIVLTVRRGPRPADGTPPTLLRLTATRAVVKPPSVFGRRVGPANEVGVIRLLDFSEATEEAFDQELRRLLDEGIKALVLDLRGNGGGVLPAAVGVVNRFLRRGVVVRMEGRTGYANRTYEAVPDKLISDTLPLVVLVNGRSASASEVVAGALQDHRRALLVGERTYGKFLVQQIVEIPDHEAALQLTTSRYYLPSGRSYQRSSSNGNGGDATSGRDVPAGILPDEVVPLDDEQRLLLEKWWENEEAVPWGEAMPFEEAGANHVDPQLARALELLQGQLVLRRIRGTPRSSRPQ